MADVVEGNARGAVDRRLEREQGEHAIDGRRDRLHALAAPRPHRRAHEVDRADAAALELRLQAKVEVRRVDADEQRDALGDQARAKLWTYAEELGQVRSVGDGAVAGNGTTGVPWSAWIPRSVLERAPGTAP